MFPVEAFERTVGKFVSIATAIELPFHLTGGAISSAYGEPRLTQDIDIVVSPEVAKNRVADLIQQLASSDFLFTESVVREGGSNGGTIPASRQERKLETGHLPERTDPW